MNGRSGEGWSDLTLGGLVSASSKYRSYLGVVAAVLLVAVVAPGTRSDDTIDVGAGPGVAGPAEAGSSSVGTGSAFEAESGDERDQAGAADGEAGGSGTGSRGGPDQDADHDSGGPAAQATMSTDAAAAPDCDPETMRIKIPTAGGIYAPNCVPIWPEGADNGGATWNGVTADTITVAIYVPQENAAASSITASAGATSETSEGEDDVNRGKVVEAFQAHFETYGRKVEWVKVQGSGPSDDDAAARADAIRVATEIGAFASIGDPSQAAGATAGGTNAYIDELASRGVLCIACTQTQPQKNFDKWAPFAWGQRISADQLYLHVAEYIGKGLGNTPAEWAGDPLLQTRTRAYGLLQYNTPDNSYGGSPAFLNESLAPYGVGLTFTAEYMLDLTKGQDIARTLMARMKERGVTTLICYCDPLMPIFFTQEATRQRYFPEWIVTGSLLTDTALFGRLYDQVQWANAHGVSLLPARVDPDALEAEVDLFEWHHGERLSSTPNAFAFSMLFTGLHLAGPTLNPRTFRDGMFSFRPASGYITRVATAYGTALTPWPDYHALDDTTEIWWDATARGPDELGAYAPGMYRYVDGGKRYLLEERLRRPSRAFDESDTTLVYDERPASDGMPTYPHEIHRH